MTKQATKSHEDQPAKDRAQHGRPSHAFDLQEVLRKARAEDLGTLAPSSF